MPPPCHPKIASNSATVAPLLAARVAPIFRTPCADLVTTAARHASRNMLPKDSLVSGLRESPQIKASSPHGPAASVTARAGRIGMLTVTPVFSVLIVATPSRTCCAQAALHPRGGARVEQHVQP